MNSEHVEHNPERLTRAQVGNGWRLLDKDEIVDHDYCPRLVQLEVWYQERWKPYMRGNSADYAYRTQLTRAQLHEKRNQTDNA